jgi:hypothetical protein
VLFCNYFIPFLLVDVDPLILEVVLSMLALGPRVALGKQAWFQAFGYFYFLRISSSPAMALAKNLHPYNSYS